MNAADDRRFVWLCDAAGNPLETCDLQEAHRSPGRLHQAFSVFVFTEDRERLLIQQRHPDKLFGGMWANSCCSHPRDSQEPIEVAGARRLSEELGFTTQLRAVGTFVYQAEDPRGLGAEHEHDTVLVGFVAQPVTPREDPTEVVAFEWAPVPSVSAELERSAHRYSPWFEPAFRLACRG